LLVPLAQDPNSRDGRETLGLADVTDVSIEPVGSVPETMRVA
jgi:hypothetical protein